MVLPPLTDDNDTSVACDEQSWDRNDGIVVYSWAVDVDSFLDSFYGEDKRDSRDQLNFEVDMMERHCKLAALAFVDILYLLVESYDGTLHKHDSHTFQVASMFHDDSLIELFSSDPRSSLHASDEADSSGHPCKTPFLN